MGLKLKIKRIEKGIQQKELAKSLGISQQYLSKLESEQPTNPSNELMSNIAQQLETSVQELFF